MTPYQIEELVEAVTEAKGDLIEAVRERLIGLLQDGGLIRDALSWRNRNAGNHGKYRDIMHAVEEEYGQPFWEVVRGFAEDGHSSSATGVMLGFGSAASFRRLVARFGPRDIDWPEPNQSVLFKEGIKERTVTERLREAFLANLAKARAVQRQRFPGPSVEQVQLWEALFVAGINYAVIGLMFDRSDNYVRQAYVRRSRIHGDTRQALAEAGRHHPEFQTYLERGRDLLAERKQAAQRHPWTYSLTNQPEGKSHGQADKSYPRHRPHHGNQQAGAC